jgi:hypothetical protein
MALPSGTFTHASGGRLQVTFTGDFYSSTGNDWGNGVLDMKLRAYVGPSGDRRIAILDLDIHSAVIEVPYTGGTSVPVGLEYARHELSGPSTVGAAKLRITCRLFAPPA